MIFLMKQYDCEKKMIFFVPRIKSLFFKNPEKLKIKRKNGDSWLQRGRRQRGRLFLTIYLTCNVNNII